MKFTIHGPYELPRPKNTIDYSPVAKGEFWSKTDIAENVSSGCGCYLFAIRAGRGIRPWYVGKAERQSFYNEVYSPHKLNIYNSVVANQKGTPVLFLILKRTSKGKLAKPTKNKNGSRFILDLEILLIGAAYKRNKKLLNIKNSVTLRKMIVPGFINSKRGANKGSVREFNSALN